MQVCDASQTGANRRDAGTQLKRSYPCHPWKSVARFFWATGEGNLPRIDADDTDKNLFAAAIRDKISLLPLRLCVSAVSSRF